MKPKFLQEDDCCAEAGVTTASIATYEKPLGLGAPVSRFDIWGKARKKKKTEQGDGMQYDTKTVTEAQVSQELVAAAQNLANMAIDVHNMSLLDIFADAEQDSVGQRKAATLRAHAEDGSNLALELDAQLNGKPKNISRLIIELMDTAETVVHLADDDIYSETSGRQNDLQKFQEALADLQSAMLVIKPELQAIGIVDESKKRPAMETIDVTKGTLAVDSKGDLYYSNTRWNDPSIAVERGYPKADQGWELVSPDDPALEELGPEWIPERPGQWQELWERQQEIESADYVDPDNISNGDFVDFGPYGTGYVVFSQGDSFWVTQEKEERFNQNARGQYQSKHNAREILEPTNEGVKRPVKEAVDGDLGEALKLLSDAHSATTQASARLDGNLFDRSRRIADDLSELSLSVKSHQNVMAKPARYVARVDWLLKQRGISPEQGMRDAVFALFVEREGSEAAAHEAYWNTIKGMQDKGLSPEQAYDTLVNAAEGEIELIRTGNTPERTR